MTIRIRKHWAVILAVMLDPDRKYDMDSFQVWLLSGMRLEKVEQAMEDMRRATLLHSSPIRGGAYRVSDIGKAWLQKHPEGEPREVPLTAIGLTGVAVLGILTRSC